MPEVKDLVSLREFESVVRLDEFTPEDIVAGFVLTPQLESQVKLLFDRLAAPRERNSFLIIGNYGSGKSHLLAFVDSLLEQPERVALIRQRAIREWVENCLGQRRFLPVAYTLPAERVPLSKVFYDQVLKAASRVVSKDAIGPLPPDMYDHREQIQRVLAALGDTTLVVIFDELADFLAAKHDADLRHDLNFLRELGEISATYRVRFIAALQEDLLSPTHPRMATLAAEINRILDRYEKVTIPGENMRQVVAERLMEKTESQRRDLASVYQSIRRSFPLLTFSESEFVSLYPVHPWVFEFYDQGIVRRIASRRSVIEFVRWGFRQVANQEATTLVTLDHALTYTLDDFRRHAEGVSYAEMHDRLLQEALPRLVHEADRILVNRAVKVLTLAALAGREMTVEEIAHALLIGEESLGEYNYDALEQALEELARKTTRFISFKGDGRTRVYTLSPERTGPDVEGMIRRKTLELKDDDPRLVDQVIAVALPRLLGLGSLEGAVRLDADWNSRRVGRVGTVILAKAAEEFTTLCHEPLPSGTDFILCIATPLIVAREMDRTLIDDERKLLWKPAAPTPEEQALLKRELAIRLLIEETNGDPPLQNQFKGKAAEQASDIEQMIFALYFQRGQVGNQRAAERDLTPFKGNIRGLLATLLEEPWRNTYPDHPVFGRKPSPAAINSLVRDFVAKRQVTSPGTSLRDYLADIAQPLDLPVEREGTIELNSESRYLRAVRKYLEEKDAARQVFALEDLEKDFRQGSYGLERDVLRLLLLSLLSLGQVVLISRAATKRYGPDHVLEALDGYRDLAHVQLSGLVENAPAVARLLDTLGAPRIEVKTPDDQRRAFEALREKTSHWQQITTASLDTLPLTITALRKLDSGQTAHSETLQTLFDVVAQETTPKECLDGAVAATPDLEAVRQAISFLTNLKVLLDKSGDLLWWHSYLERAHDFPELRSSRRELQERFDERLLSQEELADLGRDFEDWRERYTHAYVDEHNRLVGILAPFEALNRVLESDDFRRLEQLAGLQLTAVYNADYVRSYVGETIAKRCQREVTKTLHQKPFCECGFLKEGKMDLDLDKARREAGNMIQSSLQTYLDGILREEATVRENLSRLGLAERERKTIETILTNQAWPSPEEITTEVVEAINQAIEPLRFVSISSQELWGRLPRRRALTWQELRDALDKALAQSRPEGVDERHLRFTLME